LRALFRLLTFWSFAVLMALLAFQAAPPTGRLLDGFGAAYVAGWLFHFGLVAAFIEGLAGRFSRTVIVLPLLFYFGYYVAYWRQGEHVAAEAKLLRAHNPKKIFDFDPAKFSLVMDQADLFAATHAIPVVYSYDPSYRPSGYLSFRLLPVAQVGPFIAAARGDVQVLGVYWDDAKQPNVRELRLPQRPANPIVAVTVTDDPGAGWADWNMGAETTEIARGGEQIGVFRSGYVQRLPKFPFLTIGCSSAAGQSPRNCEANFILQRRALASVPETVDRSRFDDPVSIMLGLRKYSDAEFSDFQGFATTKLEPDHPAKAPPASDDTAFTALQAIVDGQNPSLAWTMGYVIANDPKRLAQLAPGMAKRFVELSPLDTPDAPQRREQAALLAGGLAALTARDFTAVADKLSGIVRRQGAWQDFPVLYVRLAEAGPKMYSFYRDRFLAHDVTPQEKLLAALAVCRVGQADGELTAAIKSEWADQAESARRDGDYKTALFAALVKLGQEDFLRQSGAPEPALRAAWYHAVLAGEGKTKLGPNNCMPMEWPRAEYIPPSLAPSLRWSHQQWVQQTSR
jgi:hypothetical protein